LTIFAHKMSKVGSRTKLKRGLNLIDVGFPRVNPTYNATHPLCVSASLRLCVK
jgi:hypothetical protein